MGNSKNQTTDVIAEAEFIVALSYAVKISLEHGMEEAIEEMDELVDQYRETSGEFKGKIIPYFTEVHKEFYGGETLAENLKGFIEWFNEALEENVCMASTGVYGKHDEESLAVYNSIKL